MAGSSTSHRPSVPWSRNITIQASKAPGTTAASNPVPGIASRSRSANASIVAAFGATPWPQITRVHRRSASRRMIGTSPPGPLRWGSTTCRTKPAATAASKALPPRSSMAIPAADASQWVDDTMPNVPRSSGRVVNMTPETTG